MFEKKITNTDKNEVKKEVKMAKKESKKEAKKNGTTAVTVKSFVIPLILATIVVCMIYIVVQKSAESKIVEKTAVCAATDIKANTYIEKKEVSDYLMEVSMDSTILPADAYSSVKELPDGGFYIENALSKNQMVMPDDVAETDAVMDKYKNGSTKTSFAVDEFANSVSGKVRSGDIVDVYAVDPATETLTLMVSKVYVSACYDSSGELITDEGTATAFTIYVAEDEVEAVNNAITYGGIQLYLTEE